ncbi:MAG: hypothetical protein RL748_1638 [Pseudomonadota bacterium]|jgi:uncharacterized protein (DUF885 family)
MKILFPLLFSLLCSLLFASGSAWAFDNPAPANEGFKQWVQQFVADYQKLGIPQTSLSYVDNFNQIQDAAGITRQKAFFSQAAKALQTLQSKALSQEQSYQADLIAYEIKLHQERLALEQDYRQHAPNSVPTGGILQVHNGRAWYRYYIKRWTSKTTSPDQLIQFGEKEVARVRQEIRQIQTQLGFAGKDAEFYQHLNQPALLVRDEAELRKQFQTLHSLILSRLGSAFETTSIPPVDIQPSPNPTKDTPPGFYRDNVFYYNFYQQRFDPRALEWLFIHEAIPGHHYQASLARSGSPFQGVFWYGGFAEGWAAYAENLGKDLGAYQDPYRYLGKWEWDLVRSARVVLDIGLNDQGWSKARALQYWQQHVPNQDAIAEREVERMLRWPGQVLAYKVGESEFLRLREHASQKLGSAFSLPRFHGMVLARGSLPFGVLERVVEDGLGRMSWDSDR